MLFDAASAAAFDIITRCYAIRSSLATAVFITPSLRHFHCRRHHCHFACLPYAISPHISSFSPLDGFHIRFAAATLLPFFDAA